MELLIRNMVCRHCVAAVEKAMTDLGLPIDKVELGRAVLKSDSLSDNQLVTIEQSLKALGFELIHDADSIMVERTKHAVLHHLRSEEDCRLNLSACIEKHLGVSYDTVSRVFSAKEGRTLEKYYIAQKIERVKELLSYHDMPLSEIAYLTGYSSVAHLSRQFKDITGMTPSQYQRQPSSRQSLDSI